MRTDELTGERIQLTSALRGGAGDAIILSSTPGLFIVPSSQSSSKDAQNLIKIYLISSGMAFGLVKLGQDWEVGG